MKSGREKEKPVQEITSLPTVGEWRLIQCDFKRKHMKYASALSAQGTKEKVFIC